MEYILGVLDKHDKIDWSMCTEYILFYYKNW